jgi:hypothetical protein
VRWLLACMHVCMYACTVYIDTSLIYTYMHTYTPPYIHRRIPRMYIICLQTHSMHDQRECISCNGRGIRLEKPFRLNLCMYVCVCICMYGRRIRLEKPFRLNLRMYVCVCVCLYACILMYAYAWQFRHKTKRHPPHKIQ